MTRRRLETLALVSPGAFLAFLAWYHAGGRDGEFDAAHLLRNGDARLWAIGSSVLLALGLWIHVRRFRAAERRRVTGRRPGGAAILPLLLASPVAFAGATVEIPAGAFRYGCNEAIDRACAEDERPGRTVSIPAFRIDRTEVTVDRYAACVEAGACRSRLAGTRGIGERIDEDPEERCNGGRADRGLHPMNCVDQEAAAAFCAWAGGRLPTEQEWEKAARGADGRRYPWGNGLGVDAPYKANMRNERHSWESAWMWSGFEGDGPALDTLEDGFAGTAPVGSFPDGASPYGALDMAGNVWEWTASPWVPGSIDRVLRGGSFANGPRRNRCSERHGNRPAARHDTWGFRCAYDIDPPAEPPAAAADGRCPLDVPFRPVERCRGFADSRGPDPRFFQVAAGRPDTARCRNVRHGRMPQGLEDRGWRPAGRPLPCHAFGLPGDLVCFEMERRFDARQLRVEGYDRSCTKGVLLVASDAGWVDRCLDGYYLRPEERRRLHEHLRRALTGEEPRVNALERADWVGPTSARPVCLHLTAGDVVAPTYRLDLARGDRVELARRTGPGASVRVDRAGDPAP